MSLSYRRAQALVVGLLSTQGSLLAQRFDKRTTWDSSSYLLADAIDRLNTLIWQQTADGHKGRNKPQPYPRPGDKTEPQEQYKKMSVDELKHMLSLPRSNEQP